MSSRTAKMIVSVLMAASLLVIGLSYAGILPSAAGPGAATEPGSPDASNATANRPSGSQVTAGSTPAAATTVPTTTRILQPLPIETKDPEPTPAQGMRQWPAASCLPAVHTADLAAIRSQASSARPLQDVTVILDPGHGGKDGGTSYPNNAANPEIIEKTIALSVANQTRSLLADQGATVLMTREKDDWLSVYNRVAQAGCVILDRFTAELPGQGFTSTGIDHLLPQLKSMISINSDTADSGGRGLMKGVGATADARLLLDIQGQYPDILFISLHCNAMGDGNKVGGLQIFYQTNDSNYKKETSYVKYQASAANPPAYMAYNDAGRLKLANSLYRGILEQVPQLECKGNSGVLIGDYAVLREINLVSALVEMGFVTSPTDREILKSTDGQRKIAQGVANAVLAYYCGDAGK